MNKLLYQYLSDVVGKPVCRLNVGRFNGLSVGVGEKIFQNNPRINTDYYGEWEFGSYTNSWRIFKNGHLISGINSSFNRNNELNQYISEINIGSFENIIIHKNLRVSLYFGESILIEYIFTDVRDEKCFHVFGPNNIYIYLTLAGKLKIAKSNEPLS